MSSADKRTVATDALETLGMIISENEKRDAIHLAVEPVIAGEYLEPNTDVGVKDLRGKRYAVSGPDVELVGKVDPFLTRPVQKGEMFWLVVYPRQIKSLRHVWEHPAFPTADEIGEQEVVDVLSGKQESRNWVDEFANSVGLDSNELLKAAGYYIQGGEYLNKGELLEGEYVPDEFWDHYEKVTGNLAPHAERGSFFTCSC